jgi:hypothetical protein
VLNRIASREASIPDLEFAKDHPHVGMDGAVADKEGLSNLRVTQTPSDEAEHLQLSRRQRFESMGRGRRFPGLPARNARDVVIALGDHLLTTPTWSTGYVTG